MTFFIQAPIDSAIVLHALEFSVDPQIESLPQVKMPVVRIPRSAKRNYSDSELSTAAIMMEKLRTRQDVSSLVAKSVDSQIEQDFAVDAVIEKLLDVLK